MTNRTKQPQSESSQSATNVLASVERIHINKGDEEGNTTADHHFVAQCKQIWDMRSWIEREQPEVPDLNNFLRDNQTPPYLFTETTDDDNGDASFYGNLITDLVTYCDNATHPSNILKKNCESTLSPCKNANSKALCTEAKFQTIPETVSSEEDMKTNWLYSNNTLDATPLTVSQGKGLICGRKDGLVGMVSLDKASFESSDGPSSESSMDYKNIKPLAELSSSIEMSLTESISSNQSLVERSIKDSGNIPLPTRLNSLIKPNDKVKIDENAGKEGKKPMTSRMLNNQSSRSSTSSPSMPQGVPRQISSETDSLATRDSLDDSQLDRDYAIDATTYQIYKSFIKQDPHEHRKLARRFRRNNRRITYPISTTAKSTISNSTDGLPVNSSDVTLINIDRCTLSCQGTELGTIVENMTSDEINLPGDKVIANPTLLERGRFLRCFKLMGNPRKDSIEEETEEDLEENLK